MHYSTPIITAFLAIGALAAPIEVQRDSELAAYGHLPNFVANEVEEKRDGASIQIYCPAGRPKDVAGEVEGRAVGCLGKREVDGEVRVRAESIEAYGPGNRPHLVAGEVEDRGVTA